MLHIFLDITYIFFIVFVYPPFTPKIAVFLIWPEILLQSLPIKIFIYILYNDPLFPLSLVTLRFKIISCLQSATKLNATCLKYIYIFYLQSSERMEHMDRFKNDCKCQVNKHMLIWYEATLEKMSMIMV